MSHLFQKHYTRDEARSLLPTIREWLARITELRRSLENAEKRLAALMAEHGDAGGPTVNQWVRTHAQLLGLVGEFRRREIQIKDLDRGLIDFPSIRAGKEVFLCWEEGEEDIEYWHDIDSGYAGREKL